MGSFMTESNDITETDIEQEEKLAQIDEEVKAFFM